MSKCMVVVLALGALVLATTAFAAPVTLSSDQMDKVAAGTGILDWFLGDLTPDATATSNNDEEESLEVEVGIPVAVGEGAISVNGDDNQTAGAIADNDATAINGEDNIAVDVDIPGNIAALGSAAGDNNRVNNVDAVNALIAGDDAHIALNYIEDVDEGAAVVVGDGNDVAIDNSTIVGIFAVGAAGVVAREATVTNSFNNEEVDIEVEVAIDDSFNVSSNCLDISGQDSIQAIVNAASTGEQFVGVNLVVTNATATMPTSQNEDSANVPIIAGNALALSVVEQTVVNASVVLDATLQDSL